MSGIFSSNIGLLAVVVVTFCSYLLLIAVMLLVVVKVVLLTAFTVVVLLDAGGLQSKFTPSLMKHCTLPSSSNK